PFFIIGFALFIQKIELRKLIIYMSISTVCLLILFFGYANVLGFQKYVSVINIVTIYLGLMLLLKGKRSIAYICILFALGLTLPLTAKTMRLSDYNDLLMEKEEITTLNRENLKNNQLKSTGTLSTFIYSSVENGYYQKLINSELVAQDDNELKNRIPSNELYDNYYSVGKNSRPLFYGVQPENIFKSMVKNPFEKIIEQNYGVTVEDATNELAKKPVYDTQLVKKLTLKEDKAVKIDTNCSEKCFYFVEINMEKFNKKNVGKHNIWVGTQNNKMYKQGLNDLFTYQGVLEQNQDLKIMSRENIVLENIKIYTIDFNKLMSEEFKYIKPTNLSYSNESTFEFEMNSVDKNAIVSSTIPFDKGFKVLVNGNEVEPFVVNEYFLGFKLNDTNNQIKIEYQIPGFKIGSISAIIGITLFLVWINLANVKKLFTRKMNKGWIETFQIKSKI
ncbi:MAG: YfhO family protein, partial [Mycoplasmatales bacterium]